MQFHIVSFEGPDAYSRAGGLATRVEGLATTLAELCFETHLWFVGDPDLPGHERRGALHLHRWAQWISRHHPGGVYDGELGKHAELSRTLAPFLLEQLSPHLHSGGRGVVLAEEWHTADTVLHLHALLEGAGLRDRAALLWNANNVFGFDRIDWQRLAGAAQITTVSRYMKQLMWPLGVDPVVIANGLCEDAFDLPEAAATSELGRRFRDRTLLVKMARFDPDKRWLAAVESVALMKRLGWRPLLLARGGAEAHGAEVDAAIRAFDLRRVDRRWRTAGTAGLLDALQGVDAADVVSLGSHVDPEARSLLFQGAGAVLANSGREPFGLVGLETMAVGGLACTGCTGEDYAVPGQNALVVQSTDPAELVALYRRLRDRPEEARAIRRAGRSTARRFAWREILERVLIPRLQLAVPGDEEEREAPEWRFPRPAYRGAERRAPQGAWLADAVSAARG